jgi:hypothetical protein
MLLKSGAPGLTPESVPDCDDDGPIGLAARRRGEIANGLAGYAGIPATDPNSSLIDELERVLRGDLAEDREVAAGDPRPRYPSFGADPLSLLDPDPEDAAEDDIVADFAAPFERAVSRAEPLAERVTAPSPVRSPLRPAAGVRHTVTFDAGDRDGFGYFDEGPPRTADFWHPEEVPALDRNVGRRRRRGWSRGYLAVSGLLLLVAAGGIYSTMQFRGDPEGTLPDPTGVTAANAAGVVAAEEPRLVNTTVELPPPVAAVADAPEGAAVAAPPDAGLAPANDPVVAEAPVLPAVEAEPEPRIVPLFRTPEDGAAAADAPAASAGDGPAANGPVLAAAEPAGAEAPTPPAAIAQAPAPATPAGGTRQATITDWVNLRADNSMNAQVILVIPMGATVELIGCPGWCEVVYNGTRGFVGPDFVDPL